MLALYRKNLIPLVCGKYDGNSRQLINEKKEDEEKPKGSLDSSLRIPL
jgi:hypothetical protein